MFVTLPRNWWRAVSQLWWTTPRERNSLGRGPLSGLTSSTSWAARPLTEVKITPWSRSSPAQMWVQKRTSMRGICSRMYQKVFSMLAHRTPSSQNPMESQGIRWSWSCSGQAWSLQIRERRLDFGKSGTILRFRRLSPNKQRIACVGCWLVGYR